MSLHDFIKTNPNPEPLRWEIMLLIAQYPYRQGFIKAVYATLDAL